MGWRVGVATTGTSAETDGSRSRSIYRITPAGRQLLRAWFAEPGDPLAFECEAAVKAFFGSSSTLGAVRVQLETLRGEFRRASEATQPVARAWLDDELPFPDRLHYTAMAADLIARVRLATDAWAADWLERLDQWNSPDLDETNAAQAREVIEGLGDLIGAGLSENTDEQLEVAAEVPELGADLGGVTGDVMGAPRPVNAVASSSTRPTAPPSAKDRGR